MSTPDDAQPDQRSTAQTPERAPEHTPEQVTEQVTERAAPRARRKPLPIWAVALVAVLIAGVAFVVLRLSSQDGGTAECTAVTGVNEDARAESKDCGDEAATFRVASTKDLSETGCPEGAYRELRTADDLLCLMPNFQADKCYVADDPNQSFKVAPCEDPSSIRISEVVEGSTDPSQCPGGNGLGYPEPPMVVCIETPGAP